MGEKAMIPLLSEIARMRKALEWYAAEASTFPEVAREALAIAAPEE